MNLVKKLLASVWPPFKHEIRSQELQVLLEALTDGFPPEVQFLKDQLSEVQIMSCRPWVGFPDYQHLGLSISPAAWDAYKNRTRNFRIDGVKVYSKLNKAYESVSFLVHDGFLSGLAISNSKYELPEFDLNRIDADQVTVTPFDFGPDEIEELYNGLDDEIRELLILDNIFDVQPNNRTYYVIHELEDGNYIAMDKSQNVYSLVHDARPAVKKLKVPLLEFLTSIKDGSFDSASHLDERYKNSR